MMNSFILHLLFPLFGSCFLSAVGVQGNAACTNLKPGDVFIWVVASDDPDGVGFLALENIPGGLELYITDKAWTGNGFATTEGIEKLVVPAAGYAVGARFGKGFDYGADETWVNEQGVFNLGVSGDSVMLYCLGVNETVNPLVAFSNAGSWAEAGLNETDYGSEQSALPDALKTVGSVVLPHLDNYEYTGPSEVEKAELQEAMMDPNNWEGADAGLGDQSSTTISSLGIVEGLAGAVAMAVAMAMFESYF